MYIEGLACVELRVRLLSGKCTALLAAQFDTTLTLYWEAGRLKNDPTTLDIWILTCTSDLRFLPTAPTAEAAGGTEAVFCTEVVAQASSDKCSWIL